MEQANQPLPYFIRRSVPAENHPAAPRPALAIDGGNQSLWEYWTLVKRHRWLIVLCTTIVFAASALYTFSRAPLYTAGVTVLMESKSPQILKVKDAQAELAEFPSTQYA